MTYEKLHVTVYWYVYQRIMHTSKFAMVLLFEQEPVFTYKSSEFIQDRDTGL